MSYIKQCAFWLILAFGFQACSGCQNQNQQKQEPINYTEHQEKLIEANRKNIAVENEKIEHFIKEQNWEMTRTGTGLRYEIYENGEGETAKNGMMATILYEIWLLDGTLVYSSEESGPKEFYIGRDNVETGLHEAVTYLKEGDKARLILPAHLAYGLTGDQSKIPSNSPILYDLQLVSLK